MEKKQISRLILISFLCLYVIDLVNAQSQSLERKALVYFYEYLQSNEDVHPVFSGNITGSPTSYYTVAYCLSEINLGDTTNSVKWNHLDSLVKLTKTNEVFRQTKMEHPPKFIKSRYVKKFERNKLTIYHFIEYKNSFYVEITLTDKQINTRRFIIEFDKNQQITKLYKSNIIED